MKILYQSKGDISHHIMMFESYQCGDNSLAFGIGSSLALGLQWDGALLSLGTEVETEGTLDWDGMEVEAVEEPVAVSWMGNKAFFYWALEVAFWDGCFSRFFSGCCRCDGNFRA